VDAAFRFTPPDGALYTVAMSANSTGVRWEPKSPGGALRLDRCKILRTQLARPAPLGAHLKTPQAFIRA